MKNKKTWIIVIAFVVLVALVGGLWLMSQGISNAEPNATTGTDEAGNVVLGASFTVVVVHADKSEKTFTYITEETNLGAFLEAEGLIDSQGSDAGMFHSVDGEKADWNENQSYWAFYIGGEYAMTGIYDTAICDSTTYKLEYNIG